MPRSSTPSSISIGRMMRSMVAVLTMERSLVPAVDLDGRQRHFFAIYDGHGGPWCAEYCSRTLHQNLIRNPLFKDDSKKALHDAVVETDDTFCALIRYKSASSSSASRSPL